MLKKNKDLLPDETLASKLIKKGFWLYFFTILIAPTGYIIRVLVSNSLSVEDVGLLYGVISFVSLISIYNDLGLTESLSYFIPKFWIKKQYNNTKTVIFLSLGVQILTGLALASFMFWGADWLAVHYFHNIGVIKILKYFSVYFLFINILQVFQSLFRAFQDVFSWKLSDLIKMGSTVIFTAIFFWGGYHDLSHYALAWIAGLILSVVSISFILIVKYKQVFTRGKIIFDRPILKEYGKYALFVFIGANAGTLLGQIDLQMLIYFIGGDAVGYYTNYLSLINISSIIIGPLFGLLFPLVVELINKGENKKLSLLLELFYKYFAVFALTLGGLLFVLGPVIASILFGSKFIMSGELLHYSALFLIFNIFVAISFNILAGFGKVKERVKILLVVAGLNFVLNLFLVPILGMLGAVISTVFGWIFMAIWSLIIIRKTNKFLFDWIFLLKNVGFIALFLIGIYYIKDSVFVLKDMYRFHNLWILIILGIGYYVLIGAVNYKSIIVLRKNILELKK